MLLGLHYMKVSGSVWRCGRSAHNKCGQNTGWASELVWSWCGGDSPPLIGHRNYDLSTSRLLLLWIIIL